MDKIKQAPPSVGKGVQNLGPSLCVAGSSLAAPQPSSATPGEMTAGRHVKHLCANVHSGHKVEVTRVPIGRGV